MYNRQIPKRMPINENTVQSKYFVGNKVYIVNSCFNGKEQLDDLLYNIFCTKSIAHKECRKWDIDKKDKMSYNLYCNHSISCPTDVGGNFNEDK